MILNVTEEQKQLIESQGYMVVQLKKWCRDIEPILKQCIDKFVDSFNLIFTFLQDMYLKVCQCVEPLVEFGIEVIDEFKLNDEFYDIETVKFPFIRSIGCKYEPNISNRVIYHRCRDRC